jgi:hypothetical protein
MTLLQDAFGNYYTPLVAASGAIPATVDPTGSSRVALPASQIFTETFDTGFDPVQWVATAGGTGIAATTGVGAAVLDGGTTLNSFSKFTSVPSFKPTQPGFLFSQSNLNVIFPVPTTAYMFFGCGTSSATPTIASPLINAFGWEIGLTGQLVPVTYASSARLAIPFTGTQPKDSNAHKYFIYFTGSLCYWCIDSPDNVVASFVTGASGPDVNNLPLLYQIISNSGAHSTLQINGVTVGDTGHSATRISDATYPWRQQIIGATKPPTQRR